MKVEYEEEDKRQSGSIKQKPVLRNQESCNQFQDEKNKAMAGENLSSYNAMKESGRDARSMKGKKKEFSLSAVNSWRSLGKPSVEHLDFYYQLYLDKFSRRKISDIIPRQKTRFLIDKQYEVWLPFAEPYPCQRDYASKVIEALRTGNNAMLESPTGTGKTISFLCAAVAFVKRQREKQLEQQQKASSSRPVKETVPHTIIYCTRTHAQIKQVIREIKTNLPYKVAVQTLASKQQLCLMEDMKSDLKGKMLEHQCGKLRSSRRIDDVPGSGAAAYRGLGSWMEQAQHQQQKPQNANNLLGSKNGVLGGNHETQQQLDKNLEPNSAKEMQSACPFYQGEEMQISHFPKASQNFRFKRFNPIIDMIDQRVIQSVPEEDAQQCMDIEDLIKAGKQHNLCPYYLAKSRLPGADIVVLPYQYVLQPTLRRRLQLNLKNSIILFDEAHNIDSNCEDVLSFDVQVENFWEAFRLLESMTKAGHTSDFNAYSRRKQATHLKCFLLRLNNAIKAIDFKSKQKKNTLGGVQKCITGIFSFELQEFFTIFDKLLMDSGDSYDIRYVSSDSEDSQNHLNLNRPPSNFQEELDGAVTARNFQKKQGHKSLDKNAKILSDHEGLKSPDSDADEVVQQFASVQASKTGKKFIKLQKREEDVKQEELQRLIESAYSCFDNKQSIQDGEDQQEAAEEGGSIGENQQLPGQQGDAPMVSGEQRYTGMDRSKLGNIIEMLEKINKIKKHISRVNEQGQDGFLQLNDFRFFVKTNKGGQTSTGEKQHITQWGICLLNPSYIFKQMLKDPEEKPLSLILTSGTLQPMKILYQELKTHFKVKLINQHFIEDHQVFASVLKTDFLGNPFTFNFENKDIKQSFRRLGLLVSRLSQSIEGGILMFFTSYTHIQECSAQFKAQRFDFKGAKIFEENKNPQSSKHQYELYKAQIAAKNKGIMMCVSRGRLSEGLNFSDNLARACLVIGIPYLLVNDSKVNLKKQYLDQKNDHIATEPDQTALEAKSLLYSVSKPQYQRITGDYWYKLTAIREVNQIIGRCIRHQKDYSSIFLIDSRYERPQIHSQLSQWVKDRLRQFDSFEKLEEDLKTFFLKNSLDQYRNLQEQQQNEATQSKVHGVFQKQGEVCGIKDQAMTFQESRKSQPVQPLPAPQVCQQPPSSDSQQSSSDDVVITAGMLGLDSSKSHEEQGDDALDDFDIDLINGSLLSPEKSFEDTFNIAPGDLSSLLISQQQSINENVCDEIQQHDQLSSKLNTSEKELLAAIIEQDSSLALPELSVSRGQESSPPIIEMGRAVVESDDEELNQSDLAAIVFSQKVQKSSNHHYQQRHMDDSIISIGEATLEALETKEQIQNSQLSFDMHELRELCDASQLTANNYQQADSVIVDLRGSLAAKVRLDESCELSRHTDMDPLQQLRRLKPKNMASRMPMLTESSITEKQQPSETQKFMQFLNQQEGLKESIQNGNNALIYGNEGQSESENKVGSKEKASIDRNQDDQFKRKDHQQRGQLSLREGKRNKKLEQELDAEAQNQQLTGSKRSYQQYYESDRNQVPGDKVKNYAVAQVLKRAHY